MIDNHAHRRPQRQNQAVDPFERDRSLPLRCPQMAFRARRGRNQSDRASGVELIEDSRFSW
jgi:hypothetical protein